MNNQNGFSYLESLIILPAMLLFLSIMFVIPILHIQRWNHIFAEEELYYCEQHLKQHDCKLRSDRLKRSLKILDISTRKIPIK